MAALKGGWHLFQSKYQISKLLCFCPFQQLKSTSSKPKKKKERKKVKKASKYQQSFHCLSVCITIPYEFIWILVLLLFQYGNFSYISAALLKGMLWIKVSESRYKQCGVTPHFSAGKNLLKKILREDTYWHIN